MSWGWLGERGAIISGLSTLAVMVGIASIISFLPLYGVEIRIDVASVGLLIATAHLGSVLTRVLAGRLSDSVGRIPVILVGMSLCAIGIFLISVFTKEIPLHGACLIVGFGMGAVLPAGVALLADVAPASMRGLAMGASGVSFYGGQAIGSTVLGIVAASGGFSGMYLFTAGTIAAILAMVFLLIPRGK
jgi:MFS transporter, DHA1 family, multidrug resistance protein